MGKINFPIFYAFFCIFVYMEKFGKYKLDIRFLNFISTSGGNYRSIHSEAKINIKNISGSFLQDKDVNFNMKIHTDGSVDFNEVGSNFTNEDERIRLLDLILENEIINYVDYSILNIEFYSFDKILNKEVKVMPSVELEKPIYKLYSIINDDITLNDNQSKNLENLLKDF